MKRNKRNKENSPGTMKLLVLAGCLAIVSTCTAAGPANSWNEWQFKRVSCTFTSAPVCALNGHALEQFATNLFGGHTDISLYAETDGKVLGVGNTSLQVGDREALFNLQAKGSLFTKGNNPCLSFTLRGKGPGTVGATSGTARLDAKFTQTQFVVIGIYPMTECYAEGKITGTVRQTGAGPLRFEDTIRIRLDDVAGLGRNWMNFQLTDNGRRLSGHSHGTNNCFGKYEAHPVELIANGSYAERTGKLLIRARGLGDSSEAAIRFTVTGRVQSAPPGSRIEITDVLLKGKAYGQRQTWVGYGCVYPHTP